MESPDPFSHPASLLLGVKQPSNLTQYSIQKHDASQLYGVIAGKDSSDFDRTLDFIHQLATNTPSEHTSLAQSDLDAANIGPAYHANTRHKEGAVGYPLAVDLGEGASLDQGEGNRTASISFYGVANPESSITGRHDGGTTYNTADAGCPALSFETSLITAASAGAENNGQDSGDKAVEHDAHPDHGMGPARVTGTSAAMLGYDHGDTDPYDADDEGLDSGGEEDDGMDEPDPIPPSLLLPIDNHLNSPLPNPATSTSTSTPTPPISEADHASLRAWFDLPSPPGSPNLFPTHSIPNPDANTDSDGTHPLTYYTDTTTGYDSLPDNSDTNSDFDLDADIADEEEEEEAQRHHLSAVELAAVIWLVEQELDGLGEGVWDGLMGVDTTDGEGGDNDDGWDTGSEGEENGSGSGSEGGDGGGDEEGLEGGGEAPRVWGCEPGCGCNWCWGLSPEW